MQATELWLMRRQITAPSTSSLLACSTSSASPTLITSLLGRNLDPYSFSFQRGIAVFDFRFNRVWHYPTRRRTRPVSLRPVLLRHVYGRPARGRMGNVGTEALTVRSTLEPLFNLPKRTRRKLSSSQTPSARTNPP